MHLVRFPANKQEPSGHERTSPLPAGQQQFRQPQCRPVPTQLQLLWSLLTTLQASLFPREGGAQCLPKQRGGKIKSHNLCGVLGPEAIHQGHTDPRDTDNGQTGPQTQLDVCPQ